MKKTFNYLGLVFALVFAFLFQIVNPSLIKKEAHAENTNQVTITNGNFNQSPTTYYLDSAPSGWSVIDSSKQTTSGIINTGSNFSTYTTSYKLSKNPETFYKDNSDTKVLMINSDNESTSNIYSQGYKSSSIQLEANTCYNFSVLAKAEEVGAFGSIYLKDENGENLLKFEKIGKTNWTEYKFYLETSSYSMSVYFELYLGTENYVESPFAMFFDNVTGYKMSKQTFDSEKADNATTQTKTISKNYITSVLNSDFENGIENWTATTAFPSGTVHKVINTNDTNAMIAEGFTHLGGDNVYGNKALWLASKDEKAYGFGYKSSTIALPAYSIYKVNVNAKVGKDTEARFVLVEEDLVKSYNEDYEPMTSELKITSNGNADGVLGGYQTYSIYVYGHTLFDSSFHIELWLGDEENGKSGSVVFDNVTIEEIYYDEFNDVSDSLTQAKLELKSISDSPSVTNGNFNLAKPNNSFPYSPMNFEHKIEDASKNIGGIVNTNKTIYDRTKNKLGNLSNPSNPEGFTQEANETNNVLVMWNKQNSYQSFESSKVNVTSKTSNAESFYDLTFDFKTVETSTDTNFNVQIFDQDGIKVFEEENITSSDWNKFTSTIRVGETTTSLTLKLSLGTQNKKSTGYVFVDNVEIKQSSITLEEFNNLCQNTTKLHKVSDLSNAYMNLRLLKNDENFYENIAFTGNQISGQNSQTGIVDATNNDFEVGASEANQNAIKNIMFIQNHTTANYSITSNFKNNLQQNKKYKFTVQLKTRLQTPPADYETKYGASFELLGVEDAKIENINTNNEWKEISIIVNSTTDSEINLRFGLNTQNETAGLLFIDSFSLTEINDEEYKAIVDRQENEKSENTLIIGSTDIKEDEKEDETENEFDWVILPALFTALALIIAVVGFVVRRIKFKKWQRKKINEYDRNKTLYKDVVRREAQEKRDEILKAYNAELKEIESEIEKLEEENRERLERQRGTKVDRKVENEFKSYAKKHTSLTNKKEKVLDKINEVNSTEYLLSLQKKLHIENAKKLASQSKTKKQVSNEESNQED